MAQSEASNPLVEELVRLLNDIVELQTMMEQGYGNKAFRRKLRSVHIKGTKLKGALVASSQAAVKPGAPTADDAVVPKSAKKRGPVMVLGEDGEQKEATQEDLESLKELGAPLGLQDRTDFKDDFGGDQDEVI